MGSETVITPRGAIRAVFVAMLLASFPGIASAKVDCEAIPPGPARTDCYLALSQFYRGQSDLAAARARVQMRCAHAGGVAFGDPAAFLTRRCRSQ
jgi:hypothetical protein